MSREKQVLLTYDQAVAMLPEGDDLRVLYGGVSIGAMPRSEVLELLNNGRPELTTKRTTEFGYGICAYQNIYKAADGEMHGSPVFIATEAA